ncbi:MAG: hypothetical protein Q9204_004395 [Flavoplaca sp. TL-2023a]
MMARTMADSGKHISGEYLTIGTLEQRELIGDCTLEALSEQVVFHDQPQAILHHPTDGVMNDVKDESAPQEILVSVDKGLSTIPTSLTTQDISLGYRSLGKALELAESKAKELHLDQVASDIETWVKAHPWKAAFYAASALSFFAPEILSLPALEALGFGFAGVRAGSMAAKIQSVIGPVAARSVFAIWQSARMGGYGVEYVNGGVRALVALADAAAAHCNPLNDCKGLTSDGGGRLGASCMVMGVMAVALIRWSVE